MTFKNLSSIIAGCLLLLATQAQAHSQHDHSYPFYGGFALGFSGSDEDCDYYGYNCDGDDTSFKFYGGKRFHENLAFEISYQDLTISKEIVSKIEIIKKDTEELLNRIKTEFEPTEEWAKAEYEKKKEEHQKYNEMINKMRDEGWK